MPDTVIARVNTLGSSQPKLITFIVRHGRLIVELDTTEVGDNSDEGKVEFPGVDVELEEEEVEIPDMEPEEKVEIQGVDTEGQYPPHSTHKLLR